MRKNILDKGLETGKIHSISPMTIGAAVGGLAGAFGGGGGETSTTGMPDWLKQYYTEGGGALDTAKDIFQSGAPDYYSGDMVANLDPMQMQAINQIGNLAGNDTLNPAAGGYAQDVLAGNYLGGDQFMGAYGQDILEGVDSRFSMGGRGGSGYHSKVATAELGDAASRLYSGERDRQNQILSNVPSLTDSAYTGATNLMRAGDVLQNQEQAEIGADVNKFNYDQNKDIMNLQTYMDFLGNVPAGQTSTTESSTNPLIDAVGGAMTGASVGSNWGK